MLTFVLVVGDAVPSRVEAYLRDPEPADVPFRPARHICWSNPAGNVHFAGWQDDVDLGATSHWHESSTGLTAFAGYVWPRRGTWNERDSWAVQLAGLLERRPMDSVIDDLLGTFIVVSLDTDGRGTVTTDALGSLLLYRSQVDGATVLSTRMEVAARVAGGDRPTRDPLGTGWLAFSGEPMGGRTGFEQVDVVPFGVQADIDPNGVTFRETTPPWRRPIRDREPDAVVDEVHRDIATSVRAALSLPVERRVMELTGGKDSRVILAVLLAEGLADEFEYRTLGSPELPDVVVAQRLATLFGLNHEVGLDPQMKSRIADRARRLAAEHPNVTHRERVLRLNVGVSSGMRSAWQVRSAEPPVGDRVALNGLYGETFSTNYPGTTRLRNHAQLRESLLVNRKYGVASILRPDALEFYRSEMMAAAYEGFDHEDAPQDVIDAMYLRERMRRWFGATQEMDENNRVLPLHSLTGVRLAFSIGPRDRHRQWIYLQLLERTVPDLVTEPFAKGGWPETVVPDRAPEPARPPALRRPRASRTEPHPIAGTEALKRNQGIDHEVMTKYLLDEPTNPVFSLLDRAAVERAVADFDSLSMHSRQQLYGAMSAAIWLGRHEIASVP